MKNYAIITMSIIILLGITVALAGNEKSKRFKKGPDFEKMAAHLNLTEDQQAQMEAIHENFRIEMTSLHEDVNLSNETKRNKMMKLRESMFSEMEKILTEEQLAVMEESREKMFGHGKRGGGPLFKGDKMDNEILSVIVEKRIEFDQFLSDEEKEIISNVRMQLPAKPREMKKDESMVDMEERQKRREDFRQKSEPLMEIVENHKTELETISEEIRDIKAEKIESDDDSSHEGFRKGGHNFENHKQMKLIHFLLMDPESHSQTMNKSVVDGETGLILYPNPVSDKLNIRFEMEEQQNVSIELLNKSGNLLKVIDVSNRTEGEQTFVFDVSQLHSGEIYYIRISKNEIVQVKKFVKL